MRNRPRALALLSCALVGLSGLVPAQAARAAEDRMETALTKGDANAVTRQELIAKARTLLTSRQLPGTRLLPATAMNWNPGRESHKVENYSVGVQWPLLTGNHNFVSSSGPNRTVALVGTTMRDTTPFAFFANDPMVDVNASPRVPQPDAGMTQLVRNTLSYLLGGADIAKSTVKVATVNVQNGSDQALRTWLSTNLPLAEINAPNACDLPAATACSAGLLIVGADKSADADKVADQVFRAYKAGTPVMFFGDISVSDVPNAIARKLDMATTHQYFQVSGLQNSTKAEQLPGGKDALAATLTTVLDRISTNPLVPADYDACLEPYVTGAGGVISFNACVTEPKAASEPIQPYFAALNALRSLVSGFNSRGQSFFDLRRTADADLLRAILLLADKARTGKTPASRPDEDAVAVTYPVDIKTDGAAVTRALFADWIVADAWRGNQPAADLGTLFCTRADLIAKTCKKPVVDEVDRRTIALTSTAADEWTSTGLSLRPGKAAAVRLNADPGFPVYVRTFNQRVDTTRSTNVNKDLGSDYDRPQYAATDWIRLTPGKTQWISSSYGGPLYVRMASSAATTGAKISLTFTCVGKHLAVLDIADDAQINKLVADIDKGAYYADLVGTGLEVHVPVSMLKKAVTEGASDQGRKVVYDQAHGGVKQFLYDIRDSYLFSIFKLAGLKVPGKTLAETVPADVKKICTTLGLPCLDEKLNSRTAIQHINYDLHAACGSLCSGNPIDASGMSLPFGWGESHELGHNLQRKQLNVHWVDTANGTNMAAKELWTNYQDRSGEVSNNIFPYHTSWEFFRVTLPDREGTGPDTAPLNRALGSDIAFSLRQSAQSGIKRDGKLTLLDTDCKVLGQYPGTTPPDVALQDAIWSNGAYAVNSAERLSFYNEMPLLMDKKTMTGGTRLDLGWNIYTLLYQAARAFTAATATEAGWTDQVRAANGLSLYPWSDDAVYGTGKTVATMPGNDFLLVQLNRITGYDWRPYFHRHGVLWTARADQQVTANAPGSGYKSLGDLVPAQANQRALRDLSATPAFKLADSATVWPGTNWDGLGTVGDQPRDKVGFHPSQCK